MTYKSETRLWLAQRASAALLAVCVVVHLVTIVYAVRGGLSAAQILGRTHGNYLWGAFYATFVIAVSIHAAIGLRTIAAEWLAFKGRGADALMTLIALALAALGLRAVVAVVA